MLTEKEKQEIIDMAVEKALLMIPEVVGNMMTNHVAMTKINSKFYKDHPEFKDHKDAVVSVIEMIEGQDPTVDYKEILEKSIPEIKKRISTIVKMDVKDISPKFNRDFSNVDGGLDSNSNSYGDL